MTRAMLLTFAALVAAAPGAAGQAAAPKALGIPLAGDTMLARTPPMGWNSWNKFACNVDEKLIRETADAIVASGMKDAGYVYVNIDDCWHGQRDSLGFIHPDPQHFPSGMKALADYIHSKGLKLGIYSDAGWKTCAGKPASRGYEFQDAQAYASWGVDYLKYDWCNTEGLAAKGAYMTMQAALHATGRPIVFSICEWGTAKPWEWAKGIGNLWRTTGDITACFDCIDTHGGQWNAYGAMRILDMQKPLRQYAGPGHWNDPDMLEVGNGMSVPEDRAHFSMWAMLAAPLIAGNDLANMTPQTRAILTNREIIAIDQDSLGIEAFQHSSADGVEVWFRPLAGGDWAVAVLNRSDAPKPVALDWRKEAVADSLSGRATHFDAVTYRVRDLWAAKELGTTAKPLAATVPAHDVLVLRLRPAAKK